MLDWALNAPLYYLLAKFHRMSTKRSKTFFRASLTKIVTVLYYHNRFTIKTDNNNGFRTIAPEESCAQPQH